MGQTNRYFDILYGDGSDQVNLTEIIEKYNGGITKIDRGIGSQWNNTYSLGTDRYGSEHAYQKLGSKSIKIDFVINTDILGRAHFRREMAGAVDSIVGVKKLRFEDEPNGYYNAIVNGSLDLSEDLAREQATGTLTFDVPDGLWHSDTGGVLNSSDTKGRNSYGWFERQGNGWVAHLNNPSNVPVYPKIAIKHKSNNGWVGIVNSRGISEFGTSTAGVSGSMQYQGKNGSRVLVQVKRGDVSVETGWGMFKDARTVYGTKPPHVYDSEILDTIKHQTVNYNSRLHGPLQFKGILPRQQYTGTTNLGWREGCIYIDIPKDIDGSSAVDWRVDFNAKFHALRMGDDGVIRIAVLGKQDEVIGQYEIVKNDQTGNTMFCAFITSELYNSEGNRTRIVNGFHANDNEYQPGNKTFNTIAGDAYFMKEGSRLTFMVNNNIYTINNEKIKSIPAHRLVISMGYMYPRSTGHQIQIMIMESISFTKLNAKQYSLVENRYKADSILTIDNYKGEVWFSPDGSSEKGYLSQGEMVIGSDFMTIPPGESDLEFHFSEWMDGEPPEIEIDFNEIYLQ